MTRTLLAVAVLLLAPVARAESVDEYRRAALAGDPVAQSRLALMYRMGRGVPQSDTEAFRWFREAAHAGDAAAQHYLGLFYLGGVGTEVDLGEGTMWLRRCAELNQPEKLLSLVWFSLEENGLPHGAVHTAAVLRNAAEQGHAAAESGLRLSRSSRTGGDDLRERALVQAAQQGNAEAQLQLGVLLLSGGSGSARPEDAVVWLRRAAAQGDARAMRSLGIVHWMGRGAEKDVALAYTWLRLAQRHGSVLAGSDADHLRALYGHEAIARRHTPEQAPQSPAGGSLRAR